MPSRLFGLETRHLIPRDRFVFYLYEPFFFLGAVLFAIAMLGRRPVTSPVSTPRRDARLHRPGVPVIDPPSTESQ